MSFMAGSEGHTWQPTMSADTTVSSYWLNWRFFLCVLWIFSSMALASYLLWRYEGFDQSEPESTDDQPEPASLVYEDEAWNTCLVGIDPSWLLSYRIISFLVLLALIIANVAADGAEIFYFYTQWTFVLVIIYFGVGSCFSFYGCYYKQNKIEGSTVNHAYLDAEQGIPKSPNVHQHPHAREIAGAWGYIFQIIFQICAGAVMLTDTVFWLILYPLLTAKDYNLDIFMFFMHSINVVFLLGDTTLNCMRFPKFRFAYFMLWTCIFVIFQWILHACVSMWWPYPFLDLSSSFAPLWYLAVALMHIPCYGIFSILVRLKHYWLSRSFPGSCRFVPW
ncbi:hypothetical protein HN51_013564 [Arachis hypogaea]|uniref:Transmembrane protein n=2 Tax=Arachis hypogaea TaxID=3818 RepID=A0A445DPQ5_ARAHY|nr:uncharacterized protein LOC112791770 isoform X1 [Arachis hypogaea]RYR65140.1 hypothetical protein Ahy_A03g011117 isoform A [Arachis hypogaea]